MNGSVPRVSVILAAYNEELFVARAIRSILEQTFTDFELIVLDDGSTDRTWHEIERFDDPRIRGVRLDRTGFVGALNHGLGLARGEYIARMDADDESLPTRFERQVAFLDAHPSVSILGTAYYKHDAMRNERYIRYHPPTDPEIRRAMGTYIPICHGSVMVRRTVIETVGGYNESLPDAEDLDLWLRAAPDFRFANLDVPLYIYWFDPRHSFFESSLGRLKRTTNKFKLSVRAIQQFRLPPHYYLLVGATLLYNFALPNAMKRVARRVVSKSRDVKLRGSPTTETQGIHREREPRSSPKAG